ncbi:MAG: hypothetical protein AVDCRST_MAG54-4157, partial [uncultured Actinomycetospora sp.]
ARASVRRQWHLAPARGGAGRGGRRDRHGRAAQEGPHPHLRGAGRVHARTRALRVRHRRLDRLDPLRRDHDDPVGRLPAHRGARGPVQPHLLPGGRGGRGPLALVRLLGLDAPVARHPDHGRRVRGAGGAGLGPRGRDRAGGSERDRQPGVHRGLPDVVDHHHRRGRRRHLRPGHQPSRCARPGGV